MPSLREQIYRSISAISPHDDLERAHTISTLSWITSGAPLFRQTKPATPPVHLVSYFLLIDPDQNKILLVDHILAEKWLPTGGHVESDEHPSDTVIREVQEELGIPATFLFPDPFFLTMAQTSGSTVPHHDVSLWYLLKGSSDQPLYFDKNEFHSVQWFPFDNYPSNSEPHLHRALSKYMQIKSKSVTPTPTTGNGLG